MRNLNEIAEELHNLIQNGEGNSEEADKLRQEMKDNGDKNPAPGTAHRTRKAVGADRR